MADQGTSPPQFASPPVEEVSLAAHVNPVHMGVVALGALAKSWEVDYPQIEEMAPMPPVPEEASSAGIRLEVLDQLPMPRIWYVSEHGDFVRQIQSDRFVQNWRRMTPEDEYPHYQALLPQFLAGFSDYEALATRLKQSLTVTLCEVTYTNPIRIDETFQTLGDLQRVLEPWSGSFSDDYLPEPSTVSAALKFSMGPTGPAGVVGSLDVTAHPAVQATTGQQVLLLQLTGRARPTVGGLEGVRHVFEAAHEWVVCGFKSMTTAEMHRKWKEE